MGCTDSKPANSPSAKTSAPTKLNDNPVATGKPSAGPPVAKLSAPPAGKLPPPTLGESGELDVSGSNYDKTKGRQRKVTKAKPAEDATKPAKSSLDESEH